MRLLLMFLFLLSFSLSAEEWKKGDSFPIQELEDQLEVIRPIPNDTKKLFFISSMSASKIVHSVLEEKEPEYLPGLKAVLISDIHKMPSLITKFVALPKMKGYKYRIYLIRDDKTGQPFPREKDMITYINLKKGKITKIQYLANQEELKQALEER